MKIILFVSDSLRPDRMSCYGYRRKTTPSVDELAQDGVTFDNCFSQGIWTVPSSASILTSTYPQTHQSFTFNQGISELASPFARPLQEAGFKTACLSSMHQIREERGFDEGFDDFLSIDEDHSATSKRIAKHVADRSIEWIEEHVDNDFFLLVWSSGTHTPFETPIRGKWSDDSPDSLSGSIEDLNISGEDEAEQVSDLYDEAVRYSDTQFGRIVSRLNEMGIYNETMVVITSDHGEILDEHSRLEHARLSSTLKLVLPRRVKEKYRLLGNYGFLGHQAVLPYDELIWVPLVVKFPKQEFKGESSSELVQSIDIGPTILEVAGSDPSFGQGRSLVTTITDAIGNDYVYSTSTNQGGTTSYHSIRDSRFKYVQFDSFPFQPHQLRISPGRVVFDRMYRLAHKNEYLFYVNDESVDVASDRPRVLERFRNEFEEWRERSAAKNSSFSGREKLNPEERQKLKDLGYL